MHMRIVSYLLYHVRIYKYISQIIKNDLFEMKCIFIICIRVNNNVYA